MIANPSELVPPESFVEEDLVVGRPYLGLVTAQLRALNVEYDPEQIESSDELDLVLIKNLRELPARAVSIKAGANQPVGAEPAAGRPLAALLDEAEAAAQRPLTDLEVLLIELRRRFAARFAGWMPEMGKNRHVGSVRPLTGPGNGRPMDFGDPVDVDGPGAGWPMAAGAPAAGDRVKVGVLDTALFPHEFLNGHLAEPHPLFELIAPPEHGVLMPMSGHATFVVSLIAKEAPNALIDLRTVLKGERPRTTVWQLAKGIVSFIGADIDILNLSLGCRTFDGEPPLVLAKAIQRLGNSVLIVAAAGNHGLTDHASSPMWPAALPDVVAVGAVDQDGTLTDFNPVEQTADGRRTVPWVAVTAPGVEVRGAYVDATVKLADGTRDRFEGWASWSGTSFAAATVTGLVAARTVPGVKSARQEMAELLSAPSVRPYVYPA